MKCYCHLVSLHVSKANKLSHLSHLRAVPDAREPPFLDMPFQAAWWRCDRCHGAQSGGRLRGRWSCVGQLRDGRQALLPGYESPERILNHPLVKDAELAPRASMVSSGNTGDFAGLFAAVPMLRGRAYCGGGCFLRVIRMPLGRPRHRSKSHPTTPPCAAARPRCRHGSPPVCAAASACRTSA
jgi:hypothetical protein